jgi:hypothetical protein
MQHTWSQYVHKWAAFVCWIALRADGHPCATLWRARIEWDFLEMSQNIQARCCMHHRTWPRDGCAQGLKDVHRNHDIKANNSSYAYCTSGCIWTVVQALQDRLLSQHLACERCYKSHQVKVRSAPMYAHTNIFWSWTSWLKAVPLNIDTPTTQLSRPQHVVHVHVLPCIIIIDGYWWLHCHYMVEPHVCDPLIAHLFFSTNAQVYYFLTKKNREHSCAK